MLIQVLEGTDNLDLERTWVRFLDEPFEIALSPDLLGRAFNGLGQPRDELPPLFSQLKRNVNGTPVNPAARAYPREFIQTGLSAIDGLNVLVRGQKLPIFSGSGLPHNRLAAQIVRQARLPGEESHFAVVFAAMGVSYTDARFFRESLCRQRRSAQCGDVPQPRGRTRHRAPDPAARRADRGGVSRVRSRSARPRGDDRHDALRRSACAKWRRPKAMCLRAKAIPATSIRTWRKFTSAPGASATSPAQSP